MTDADAAGSAASDAKGVPGIRARARREITEAIKEAAHRQVATAGAASLSLRAIARELAMSSSAIYRYFASKDELITALVIDAYTGLGDAAEAAALAASGPADAPGARTADADCASATDTSEAGFTETERGRFLERWIAVCRGARDWALSHPQQYALIYGTPVPGYHAPRDTVGPGTRVALLLAGVVAAASAQGVLEPPVDHLDSAVAADMAVVITEIGLEMPPEAVALVVAAWAEIFGLVGFELFGQFTGVVSARDVFFDLAVTRLGRGVGLPG